VRECAARFGIARAYTDYREMLAAGGLDAVLVITPNVYHAPVTIAAIEAGCHVLVEKPMALNGDEAQRMAGLARERGKVLAINLHQRFRPVLQVVRELIDAGELGTIYQAHAAFVRRAGIPGYGSWFTTARLAGGGALMDIGVHVLDLALWALDEPEVLAVSATTSNRLGSAGRGLGQWGIDRGTSGPFEVEDAVTAYLRCAGGAAITLDVAWAAYSPTMESLRLLGTGGGLAVERRRQDESLELYTDVGGRPATAQPEVPPQSVSSSEVLLRGFIESVRTGAPPPVGAEAGVRLARLCDAIYESARLGREVRPAGGQPEATAGGTGDGAGDGEAAGEVRR
jgi:predicted dehydrogenase